MSWSIRAEHVPFEQSKYRDELVKLREETLKQDPGCGDQFDAALIAALAVIQSGSIGQDTHTYCLRMSGHSNPDHKPKEGAANDMITINVYQESK